jgi:tRNA nucleotidyltransferase (CCA-adding enzyme)
LTNVVGATPKEMLDKGFRQVGSDFPVFLHPETNEEYALARTERKTGKGYTGFECFADPTVTLEQDLERRDLTINAMAQACEDPTRAIIDPFKGQEDLKNKILRHVSPAFAEDPVRILRIARFAARFPDFTVDFVTNQLMEIMVGAGEVDSLVSERVWKEFSRALTETDPGRFFEVLKACGALHKLFPELQIKQSSLNNLHRALSACPQNALIRFGAIALGLNKSEITSLCQRLHTPTRFSELAILVSANLQDFQTLNVKDAESAVNFLERIDAYRRPDRFFDFCQIISLRDENSSQQEKLTDQFMLRAFQITKNINAAQFTDKGLKGEEIGTAIHNERIKKLNQESAH